MLQEIRKLIEQLYHEDDKKNSQNIAIELANKILIHLGATKENMKSIEDALENAFPFSYFKNQKMETWFEAHRFYESDRFAFKLYGNNESSFESSFFHLTESSTKARIALTTLLGTNWEDSELTELPEYKVGVDFFLNYQSSALLMVVSKRGNIRAIEFSERLTNTQFEILNDLKGVLSYKGLDPETGKLIPREPQKTIHELLWKGLQLNEVNKKFYQGISEHFQKLVSELKKNHLSFEEKDIQLFSSRLIGRLLFIWFLRKMDLINKEMNYFDLEGHESSIYYEKKIKPLFFETLNLPITERKHKDLETPFLNGGLFEVHDNDFYDTKIKFPRNFFNSLYEHLNGFNFTVDESTPEYEQVAIDPEMLGRVFENLLASIVPETSNAANERKNKGAFYTPREIVSFMCKESLKEFFKTKLDDDSLTPGIEKLIDLNDAKFLELKSTGLADLWGVRSKDVVPKLIDSLNDIKIFDPACGSGAFPMGMLQLISRTYDRLTAKYDLEKKKHIPASGRTTYNKYESKLNIIRNNLYGSDIEPMAIEIARLRSWLSLIIEEKGQAHPLPNLDFNFVCSNTLIKLEEDNNLFGMSFEDDFEKLREKYYNVHSKEAKLKLREEFETLYQNNYDDTVSSKRVQQLKSWNPFDISKPSDFFDAKTMFNVEGFDIVIANPPYVNFSKIDLKLKSYLRDNFKSFSPRGDLYTVFIEKAIDLINKKGIFVYITSNKWLINSYANDLRNLIIDRTNPIKLIDLGADVFESATVDTAIIVAVKDHFRDSLKAVCLSKTNLEELNFSNLSYNKSILLKNTPFIILNEKEHSIIIKLLNEPDKIDKIPGINIGRGLMTGFNDAFLINKETYNIIKSEFSARKYKFEIDYFIKKVIAGKDIKNKNVNWDEKYIIFAHHNSLKLIIDTFPIYNHLIKYEQSLKARAQCRKTASKEAMHHWLELDNRPSISLVSEYNNPKIIWPDISENPNFVIDRNGYFVLDTAYTITGSCVDKLYNYLNSEVIKFLLNKITPSLGNNSRRYKSSYIKQIPVSVEKFLESKEYEFPLSREELEYITNQYKSLK
jgi:hypothetical protein